MSKTIQELAKEAGLHANQDVEKFEKFAKLIARECADVCDKFQARDVGMQPAECAGAIRRLFGIERMNVKKKEYEYTIEFDVRGGSSILGRFIRLLLFPFIFVLTGRAKI